MGYVHNIVVLTNLQTFARQSHENMDMNTLHRMHWYGMHLSITNTSVDGNMQVRKRSKYPG